MRKYGVLDFDLTVNDYWNTEWNKKALLNIGDAAQYLVCEQLLNEAGIESSELIRLSIHDLKKYRGETIFVPLNLALDSYVGYNGLLENLSPNIIPLFLGMSFTDPNLNEKQKECLTKFAPIGCRDERSFLYLKSLGIPCYLNGCCTVVLNIHAPFNKKYFDKIVFIDVPLGVSNFIPNETKKDIVFFNQEKYCTREEFGNNSPTEWARKCLSMYSSKPKLIVTSRFHGGALSLANNIPAIITIDKYTFRFSWLDNYFPIYTEDTYDSIVFDAKRSDQKIQSHIKKLISDIAKARILGSISSSDNRFLQLTNLQLRKNKIEEKSTGNQVLYYRRVWEKIKNNWNHDTDYKFAFWGINDNSTILFELIKNHYPRAKLVGVYDLFRTTKAFGFTSKKPLELCTYANDSDFYVIVTAYLASRVAKDIFKQCHFNENNSFLCEREFVTDADLERG